MMGPIGGSVVFGEHPLGLKYDGLVDLMEPHAVQGTKYRCSSLYLCHPVKCWGLIRWEADTVFLLLR
jgi:hypothetical protein